MGDYAFVLTSDDGSRLYIDEALVVNDDVQYQMYQAYLLYSHMLISFEHRFDRQSDLDDSSGRIPAVVFNVFACRV